MPIGYISHLANSNLTNEKKNSISLKKKEEEKTNTEYYFLEGVIIFKILNVLSRCNVKKRLVTRQAISDLRRYSDSLRCVI